MKLFFSIAFIFFTAIGSAQEGERIMIEGNINVPEGETPEGIAVINITGQSATVSNEEGYFDLQVTAGDTLRFSSLQFQDFSVIVDEGVIEQKELNVFVSEAVNVLPEVVVTPYDLSGNVRVDVEIIPAVTVDLPDQSAAEINPYEWEFAPDPLVSPPNAAMRFATIYSGNAFDMANIFRHIFTTRDVINDLDLDEDLEEQLKELREDDFFEEHLNIKEENIEEFIVYAAEHGLTPEMLDPDNELILIDFLVARSFDFKNEEE